MALKLLPKPTIDKIHENIKYNVEIRYCAVANG